MIDLEMNILMFRNKVYEDKILQEFIKDIFVVAGERCSKRAVYTFVYLLMGKKKFPQNLQIKIDECMKEGVIEKTFLYRNNYEQRVYGMLSKRDLDTGAFIDFYYEDELQNLGNGSSAKRTGRGLSKRRQKFLQKELLNYNLKEALEVICDQFIYDKKYGEICEAEKEILNLSKYYYDEEYWDERNERIAEEEIEGDLKLTETEKESLILARRGQGKFRKNVLERTKFCPFTGISNPALLIASHIKPWKASNNNEKIDGNNGFAFTPTYDRLFDQGYISFGNNKDLMINTFQFRYGMLYKEIALEDMVGMTTLEVLEPELYKWICNNKEAVCGGFMHGLLSHSSNKPDYRNLYYNEFKSLGIDPDLAISCVSTMFPVFANDVSRYPYSYQPTLSIRSRMRIAYEERFDLYFMFDLDDIKVSRSIINASIYEFDRDVLSKIIEKINEEGNIVYFLEEIRSLVDKIPYKRLELIASVLLGLQEEFKEENSEKLFALSASDIAEYLMEDIIDRLKTEEEKYGIICSVIENVDITGLGIMTRFINRIELAYGRLAGNSEEKDKQIISLEHLKKLENIYVAKVRDIVNSGLILERNEFNKVFCLWKCFDKDGVEIYLKELFKTEVNKLKFICAMATKWSSTNGSEWSFYPQNYSEYISQDEVYNMIQGFDKSKLNQFTDIEQIKLASFVLNYNKNEMDHVDEQEVLNLISEWKTGKEE